MTTQPQGPFQGPLQPTYQSQPPPPPSPPAKPAKVKRFGWPTVLIAAAGSWFVGLIMGIGGESTTTTTAEPAPTVFVTETETASASKPSAAPTTQAPKPADPKTDATIGDGTHEVGVDVQPGQYKTSVPDGNYCYWERMKDDSGDFDSIISNESIDGPARASVTIKKGEFFKSEDCGTWQKVK